MIARNVLCVILFLLPFAVARNAVAGKPEYRGEVFGTAGFAKVWDDESDIGNGADFGGGIEFRVHRHIGIQFEVDRAAVSRDFLSGVRFEGTNVIFGGNAHFYFRKSNIEPYVLAGIGVNHLHETSTFSESESFESTTDTVTLQVGGGVRIPVSRRISLRPEFRISLIRQVRGSISVGYCW